MPRNAGSWTEARFHSFVKSVLRAGSRKWPPKYQCINDAYVGTKINPKSGRRCKFYKCACCNEEFPLAMIEVDHINPIVPITGFTTWDEVINNLFCEKEDLQAVCKDCHKIKTKAETQERKQFKDNNNE